jgi:hypothetical protein
MVAPSTEDARHHRIERLDDHRARLDQLGHDDGQALAELIVNDHGDFDHAGFLQRVGRQAHQIFNAHGGQSLALHQVGHRAVFGHFDFFAGRQDLIDAAHRDGEQVLV